MQIEKKQKKDKILLSATKKSIFVGRCGSKYSVWRARHACRFAVALLFQRLKRENVPSDADSKSRHQQLRPPPLVNHRENTVADGQPYERYGAYLHAKRDGTMFAEIANILAEYGVRNQPIVKCRRRLNPQCSSE